MLAPCHGEGGPLRTAAGKFLQDGLGGGRRRRRGTRRGEKGCGGARGRGGDKRERIRGRGGEEGTTKKIRGKGEEGVEKRESDWFAKR